VPGAGSDPKNPLVQGVEPSSSASFSIHFFDSSNLSLSFLTPKRTFEPLGHWHYWPSEEQSSRLSFPSSVIDSREIASAILAELPGFSFQVKSFLKTCPVAVKFVSSINILPSVLWI